NNHVYGFFDAFCTTGEAGRDKNCPDVYLLAASKLGVSPNECVVFEDVLKGVVSAKNAGMTAVGVYDRYSEEDIITIRAAADRFIMNFSEMMK
ncbi:MAG: HAD family phosphatase, partial [Muribaculaceae bacterium]|nr:HAD family phosphatase [Muribaculaceae bacterium]